MYIYLKLKKSTILNVGQIIEVRSHHLLPGPVFTKGLSQGLGLKLRLLS